MRQCVIRHHDKFVLVFDLETDVLGYTSRRQDAERFTPKQAFEAVALIKRAYPKTGGLKIEEDVQ